MATTKENLCPLCGKPKTFSDKTLCINCWDKLNKVRRCQKCHTIINNLPSNYYLCKKCYNSKN